MTDGDRSEDQVVAEFEQRVRQLESSVREAHEDLFERLREQTTATEGQDERLEQIRRDLQAIEERVGRMEHDLAALSGATEE